MFPSKHYRRNRSNSVLATWRPSVGRIYTVLSDCIFARNSDTILVGMGDFMRLLFSIKATSKCLPGVPTMNE